MRRVVVFRLRDIALAIESLRRWSKYAVAEVNNKKLHSSPISSPNMPLSRLFHHPCPSGCVNVSNTSCESELLVEWASCPFGVPGLELQPELSKKLRRYTEPTR